MPKKWSGYTFTENQRISPFVKLGQDRVPMTVVSAARARTYGISPASAKKLCPWRGTKALT